MAYVDSKLLAPLRILQILRENSDENHIMTQAEIAKYLEDQYGIVMERKSIGRDIDLLIEAEEFGVEKTTKGTYILERDFEDSELKMLIDTVLSSRYISPKYSKDLIEKLKKQSNKYFTGHIKHAYSVDSWGKTKNPALFINIDTTDYAIESGLQIEFDYNKYKADKELHYSSHHTVSPYLMIVHNQRYYLMGYHEKYKNIIYYRLDHITNIKVKEDKSTPIKSVPGYEGGIDYKKLSASMPYMFSDKAEWVTLLVTSRVIDQMVDWFGYEVDVVETLNNEESLKIRVKASQNAMTYFALQYLGEVEVLEPSTLRERIKKELESGMEKYK